jgi:hypothetical protein
MFERLIWPAAKVPPKSQTESILLLSRWATFCGAVFSEVYAGIGIGKASDGFPFGIVVSASHKLCGLGLDADLRCVRAVLKTNVFGTRWGT